MKIFLNKKNFYFIKKNFYAKKNSFMQKKIHLCKKKKILLLKKILFLYKDVLKYFKITSCNGIGPGGSKSGLYSVTFRARHKAEIPFLRGNGFKF